MKIKYDTLALLAMLLLMMIGAKEWLWYHLKPLPRLDKIIIYLLFGLFVSGALLYSAGLWETFLTTFFNFNPHE